MSKLYIPKGYYPILGPTETQRAIKRVKDHFQRELADKLNLGRVSAPLFVIPEYGLNDNLNGYERRVEFTIKDMDEQNHNALDDAKLLKMVYDKMKTGDRSIEAFSEYMDPLRMPDEISKVLRMNGNTVLEEFNSLKEAVNWVKSQPNSNGHKYIQNAEDKIKNAAKNGSRYFDCNWRIV